MGTMHIIHNEVAMEVGVTAAMILEDIGYWVKHNEENQKNIYDGYVWTYNSIEAFKKQYPFFSESTIKRTLAKLEEDGYIITGNYNKVRYDRTKWYALTEKGIKLLGLGISNQALKAQEKPIVQNDLMQDVKMNSYNSSKCTNGFGQNEPIELAKKNQPIPEHKQRISTITPLTPQGVDGDDEVISFWDNNIHPITPFEAEQLCSLIGDYSSEWVLDALKVAVENNARTMTYVKRVLENRKNGVTPYKNEQRESTFDRSCFLPDDDD